MRKLFLIAASLAGLAFASPALADDDHRKRGFHGDKREYHDDRRDYRYDRRDYRDDRRDYRYDRRDYRDDRRDYRDGFRDGRYYDDRYEDRRVYRQGFRDGRRFDRYDYHPHFRPRFDYGRRAYYRYDFYDAPWRRPYVIGRPLPRNIGFRRVDAYAYGLPPCPRGYYYADVGGDILLVALATGIIADALVY